MHESVLADTPVIVPSPELGLDGCAEGESDSLVDSSKGKAEDQDDYRGRVDREDWS